MRILIPPGVGDAYWVLVKLQAFLRKVGASMPELTVVCTPDEYGGELRSIPFLKMFPFVKVGSPECIPNDPDLYDTYLEAYSKPGRTIFPGFQGYDYFISYNGHLNSGNWLEDTDPDLECNWFPEMIVSEEQEQYRRECLQKYGDYIAFYWPFFGSFETHISEFSVEKIARSMRRFLHRAKSTPVFIGAATNVKNNNLLRDMIATIPGAVDLVGKTTLDQTFGLVKGSRMVVGYHSGVTNMAVVFRKKTLLVWASLLPPRIAYACFPPETRETNYFPLFAKELTVREFVAKMKGML